MVSVSTITRVLVAQLEDGRLDMTGSRRQRRAIGLAQRSEMPVAFSINAVTGLVHMSAPIEVEIVPCSRIKETGPQDPCDEPCTDLST